MVQIEDIYISEKLEDIYLDHEPLNNLVESEYLKTIFRRTLNKRERYIIFNHFYMGHTLKEIGVSQMFKTRKYPEGVSRERICQIKREAIKKLTWTFWKDSTRYGTVTLLDVLNKKEKRE